MDKATYTIHKNLHERVQQEHAVVIRTKIWCVKTRGNTRVLGSIMGSYYISPPEQASIFWSACYHGWSTIHTAYSRYSYR